MKDFNRIGEDLFNKLRGRFQNMTIGDDEGNVTNEPTAARFFDFEYSESGAKLGKVSVSIDEDDGLTVIYSRDFIQNEDEMTQKNWYNFLRELRKFSKKRLLNFDVRDINKTNLTKRDYKFLATNRPEDINMTESKLYGTGRVSYQNVDSARLVVKHTENIDQTTPSARTRKIGSIYIESSEGERFKYPYKHMSGARAMARHVAEGGNPYDDFGTHITGLSEEMSKLRKFKNYMGRSSVMAESLADYMDIVKERISTVKKTIENLQKPNYYREAVDGFEAPMFEDVPDDVAENWVDQLTIRQFNEELADVFPYIYNLVKEGTKAKALGPEDLMSEDDDPCWKNYKMVGTKKKGGKTVPNCVPEEQEIEEHFNSLLGQFAEAEVDEISNDMKKRYLAKAKDDVADRKKTVAQANKMKNASRKNFHSHSLWMDVAYRNQDKNDSRKAAMQKAKDSMKKKTNEAEVGTVYMRFRERNSLEKDARGNYKKVLVAFAGFANSPEELQMDTASRKYMKLTRKEDIVKAVKDVKGDKVFVGAKDITIFVDNPAMAKKYPQLGEALNMLEQFGKKQGITVEYKAKDPDRQPEKGSGKKREPQKWANPKYYKDADSERTTYFTIDNDRLMKFLKTKAPSIMNSFRPNLNQFVMDQKEYRSFRNWLKSEAVVLRFGETNVRVDKERSFSQDKGREFEGVEQEEQKTPLGEFILSYFDRQSGQFPKGETAILTMVEKDYGEEFIEPAKAFIGEVNNLVAERFGFREPTIQEVDIDEGMDSKSLMGEIRKMAKGVETSPDEREHRIFAQQVESKLVQLFQIFSQQNDMEKKRAVQQLISRNKQAQRETDRRNANNIVSILWELMNANETEELGDISRLAGLI